jgi:hypothetical protein
MRRASGRTCGQGWSYCSTGGPPGQENTAAPPGKRAGGAVLRPVRAFGHRTRGKPTAGVNSPHGTERFR